MKVQKNNHLEMNKKFFLTCENISLIKVTKSVFHAKTLYNILKSRDKKNDISHRSLPTFKEHQNFINSMPYRYWLLIYKKKNIIGSVYITYLNEISIKLIKNNSLAYKMTLYLIVANIKPLSPIPSKRNKNFVINISPKDKFYVTLLSKIGAKKIQETFKFDIK